MVSRRPWACAAWLLPVGMVLAAPVPAAATAARRSRESVIHALERERRVLPVGPRLCVRVPDRGPEAIVVVTTSAARARARRLLREARVRGAVEVSSRSSYERRMEIVRSELTAEIPDALRPTVHISTEVPPNRFECIKAVIELEPSPSATAAETSWAQTEIQRYGSDRVRYRHEPIGEAT